MIPVIWWQASRGNWDHGLLLSIFEKHPELFKQYNTKELYGPFGDETRGIIIVTGRPEIEPLRAFLERFKSGLVILTSEEDAYFEWKLAIPGRFEIWTQYWNAQTKGEIKERLLIGAPLRIRDYKINRHLEKKYLWSFVGQVQNPFRQKCVDILKGLPDGFLRIVDGFGGQGDGGMDYQEYLDIMCQSKYVICPAGSMSVDSFRLYEAMECGAIPITDMRAPRDNDGTNFWTECYSRNNLIQISEWSQSFISELFKQGWLWNNDWWIVYKQELEQKLLNIAK